MPSSVEICRTAMEKKIFEEILAYMGMAAILVMRPGLFIYIYWFPHPIDDSQKKLALICQAVSEEKMFEYYGNIHVYCPGVGHDLYIHCSTGVIDASCQVSLKSVERLRKSRFLKEF